MRRRVYDFGWECRSWKLRERKSGYPERTYVGLTKKTALSMARALCREIHEMGELVQLVVRGKDGRILFEATYGKDPKRRVG